MARQEALIRLQKTLLARRAEILKKLHEDIDSLRNYRGETNSGDSADQVFDRYEPYLKRINTASDRSWVREKWLFTDRAGQPVVHAQYHEPIPPHRTPVPGLYLANTPQIYPEDRGQNYSLLLGEKVAQMMHKDGIDATNASHL